MSYDAIVTISVIVLALVLFATEIVRLDVVAIGIMVVLVATQVLNAEEAIKGFANTATLTVAAMFVLSDALIKTGVIQRLSDYLSRILDQKYYKSVGIMATIVGGVSAFINNTPVVATLIPIVSTAASDIKKSPAKFLIPLSYGAIFGGACTLIGTSTNLLVSGILGDAGYQEFSMFTMAPLGLVFFGIGSIYLMFFIRKLIPIRTEETQSDREKKISDFLIKIVVKDELEENATLNDYLSDYNVLFHSRGDKTHKDSQMNTSLKKDDILLVKSGFEEIKELLKSEKFDIHDDSDTNNFPEEATELVEIVIMPNSTLSDKKLKDINFLDRFQAVLLAIRQRGKENFKELEEKRLKPGDVLLLQATEYGAEQLNQVDDAQRSSFLPMRRQSLDKLDRKKLTMVLATLAVVVLLATFSVLPIVIAAFGGIVFLTIVRVITMQDAYKAIDWKVIFLLAGALSLGAAMNKSGITDQISQFLNQYVSEEFGPVATIAILYLTAALLTEVISNNATAALLTPVAINLAESMETNVLPLALTVAYACSSSFLTPVSYQTNTMVYSAGSYRYFDFVKTGIPLKIIFWIVASILIPWVYSL